MKSEANKPETTGREVDPEHLMKLLDVQLAQQRQSRPARDFRMSFRVWSLVAIVGGTIVALFVLQWLLAQIPRPSHLERQQPTPAPAIGKTTP